jgi:glycosyltransferase involved in cell wall biosynthesis
MKIAVNTRLLLKDKLEGIGWFSYETLKRITQNHPEHQFYFIFDRPFHEDFIFSSNITPIVAYPPARHPYLWYLFFEYGIPYQLNKIKPDLFLSIDGWLPLNLKCKSVDVIHDINFEHHPEFITPKPLWYYRKYFHQFAQKATRIATVSEYSKKDIQETYQIEAEKIDVVYNGCNTLYRPLSELEKQEIRNRYSVGNPYFLFVGLVHKRKNIENLFQAFDIFKTTDQKNTKLLIVGSLKGFPGDIENTYLKMQYKEDVIFLGRKEIQDLILITGAAEAMLYVSFFEGFGIPILEGFHAEIPVITSNTTSMPEIAGDAAMIVDPYSISEITESLHKISIDQEYRKILVNKGIERRKLYNWDLTAEKLWNSILLTLFT